jgi:hypothetical protein
MVKDLERGRNNVRDARIRKAQRFMRDRQGFMTDLAKEIERLIIKAQRKGKRLCVRLNGSTDIAWEGVRFMWGDASVTLLDLFPDVQFVDYTKIASRFNRSLPPNYHLTFSRSETNEHDALKLLGEGRNVSVVFQDKPLHTWHGYPVVDGDKHDLRHLDPRGGYVIALSPKGHKIKRDVSGFMVRDSYAHDLSIQKEAA